MLSVAKHLYFEMLHSSNMECCIIPVSLVLASIAQNRILNLILTKLLGSVYFSCGIYMNVNAFV